MYILLFTRLYPFSFLGLFIHQFILHPAGSVYRVCLLSLDFILRRYAFFIFVPITLRMGHCI